MTSIRKPRKPSHRDKSHAMPMPVAAHITRYGGTVALVLPYPPSDNSITRHSARIVKGKSLSMDYPSAEAKQYRKSVAQLAAVSRCVPLQGDLTVEVTLFRPRKIGDVYRLKLLLDSLEGIAYVNDSQIKELWIEQRDDKARPRAEVLITSLAKRGTSK